MARKQEVTLKISPQKFRDFLKLGYSIDHIFLLSLSERGLDTGGFSEPKEKAILQSLHRKGLLTDKGEISQEGIKLLQFSLLPDDKASLKLLPNASKITSQFQEWWKAYPGTDSIIRDGKVIMKGSRSLRNSMSDCEIKYNKILLEGNYTHEQLLSALKYEVSQKVSKSIKERKNCMTYMKNSLSYLNQRAFEGFIEDITFSSKEDSNNINNTGIVGI